MAESSIRKNDWMELNQELHEGVRMESKRQYKMCSKFQSNLIKAIGKSNWKEKSDIWSHDILTNTKHLPDQQSAIMKLYIKCFDKLSNYTFKKPESMLVEYTILLFSLSILLSYGYVNWLFDKLQVDLPKKPNKALKKFAGRHYRTAYEYSKI